LRAYLVRVADVVAGRYELGRLIGTGGNGRVFAARDRVLDRPVAVKLVDAEAVRHRDPAGRERFLEEARSSAGFIHPNAVAVFDAGEADGSLYLVMELVEGETLADRIAAHGAIEPTSAARIASDVLAALDAAHRAGIVHRDVKPANVLLDARGTAKLADFGIAKRLDTVAAALTSPGQFFGTPKYLAPEQVDGRAVSAATDVYAMGVVLFEMLAGTPPFDEEQPMATAIAQRDAPVPDLRAIRPDLPDILVAIVERALHKDPADRFESAAAMRTALTAPLWPAPPAAGATVAVVPPAEDRTAVMPVPATSVPATAVAPADVGSAVRRASPAPAHVVASAGPPFRNAHRRSGATRTIAIVLVVIALGALALALALRGGDGGDPADAVTVPDAGTVADGGAVDPAAGTAVTPASTAPPFILPANVAELIDFLEDNTDAVGARGEDLLAGLTEVEDLEGKQQREAAEALSVAVGDWAGDGELDEGIGSLTQQLLARVVVAPEEGDGDGKEEEKEKEKERDD
jgi:serine/threonine-protein kinase